MNTAASITLAAGFATILYASRVSPATKPVEPNPVWQAQIDRVVRAGSIDLDEYRDVLILRTMVRQDRREFIRQVAYYSMQVTKPEADATGEDLTEDEVRTRFALERVVSLVGADIASARMQLLEHLDTEDPKLQRYLYETVFRPWVSECTDETHAREFISYISAHRTDQPLAPPPWSVIGLLFERRPALGMMEMERIYRQDYQTNAVPDVARTLEYAAHVVEDFLWRIDHKFDRPGDLDAGLNELEKLSKMQDWWPRLYVAEILRMHPIFRRGEIVERLGRDENQLVRSVIATIADP